MNINLHTQISRMGVVVEPNGAPSEVEGVLNPASARDRQGRLLLFARAVARGNVSRVSMLRATQLSPVPQFERLGFALEPQEDYEFHGDGGNGCEDPRVTFVPAIDKYVMCYTAYGKQGPRVALAVSDDAYVWQRLGLVRFPTELGLAPDDKDAAFFPEPVLSPAGDRCLAFYHRPMTHFPPQDASGVIPAILAAESPGIRIAYVPLHLVLESLHELTRVAESHLVMSPVKDWGRLKLGGGSAPVRIKEGWLSIFHGVDSVHHPDGRDSMRYSAGIVIHDAEQPHKIVYRSASPILSPESKEELRGTVNNVVFPTALDPRPDLGDRVFDVYYGMADYKIGLARLELPQY